MKSIDELVEELECLTAGKHLQDFNRSGRGELFILKYLFEKNTKVIPSELSEALQSSTARISALLGKLEKKGQICREIDPSNRRNILVSITDAGCKRIQTLMQQIKQHMTCVLTEMGEQDANELVRLMKSFFEIARRTFPDIDEFGGFR